MSRNLSVFVDLLRLSAALLVLIGHAGIVFSMKLPDLVAHSAKEGVATFFVLSGFVIAFVTATKERDWKDFAQARVLRMYSVIPLAVVVMIVCYAAGSAIDPALYGLTGSSAAATNGGAIGGAPEWLSILRYLSFTNELWFNRALISTGAPFWSLAFEVAYYIVFAFLFYARGYWRLGLVLLWALLFGPRIVVAFPLWLLGVGAWTATRRINIDAKIGVAFLGMLALSILCLRRWAGAVAIPLFEWPSPAAMIASMAYYLTFGVLVAAVIVVFSAIAPRRSIWPEPLERAIRFCAGASFTLYIAHLPVMVLLAAIWPESTGSTLGGFAATGLTVAAMFALAELGERRKVVYARALASFLKRMRPVLRRSAVASD